MFPGCYHNLLQYYATFMARAIHHHWKIQHEATTPSNSATVGFLARRLDRCLARALHAFDARGVFDQDVNNVTSAHVDSYNKLKLRDDLKFHSFVPFKLFDPPFSLERI